MKQKVRLTIYLTTRQEGLIITSLRINNQHARFAGHNEMRKTMEFNKEYVKTILEENFLNSDDSLSLRDYTELELENYPECFNCFFETSWDELTTEERSERKELILSIV